MGSYLKFIGSDHTQHHGNNREEEEEEEERDFLGIFILQNTTQRLEKEKWVTSGSVQIVGDTLTKC